jgi:hypothetical protein
MKNVTVYIHDKILGDRYNWNNELKQTRSGLAFFLAQDNPNDIKIVEKLPTKLVDKLRGMFDETIDEFGLDLKNFFYGEINDEL